MLTQWCKRSLFVNLQLQVHYIQGFSSRCTSSYGNVTIKILVLIFYNNYPFSVAFQNMLLLIILDGGIRQGTFKSKDLALSA
jgi:uncharacterized membrane protein